jgi:hypothetical protein
MEILLSIVVAMVLFNTLLLIAVAGSVAKLIKSSGEDVSEDKKQQSLPMVGPPTYDLAVLNGKAEPYTDGMDRRLTPTRNWDGVSQT